ncbi:hypothetical protein GQ600_8108 [Phytophthora cactorum]|nr:hypothetical protein GQ600_8108 [Phytophthora cactorum]
MARSSDTKQALLLNPEFWTPKQLEEWLKRFEDGRYARFVGPLKGRKGAEVVRFTAADWAQLNPQDLATSLRFTLLGMVQVATNANSLLTVLRGPLADIGIDSESLVKYGSIPLVSCLQIPDTNTGFGWQGIVPNKGKDGSTGRAVMTHQLLQVSEVFAKIEPPGGQGTGAYPVQHNSHGRGRYGAMALKYSPELWAVLPAKVKEEIVEKVKEESPAHIEALMDEIRNNIEDVFDLEDMVVTNMCKDKQLLVNMFVTCGYSELAFIRNSGLHGRNLRSHADGYLMIFEPVNPKRYCGITFHGLFLRRQNEVAEVYGKMVARDVLNSRNIFEAILKGPYSDRLFELVYDNVQEAVNAATETTQKIINFSIGEEMYGNIKEDVTNHIVEIFPDSLRQIESYATVAMDLEVTLREKMKLLTSEQFENLLHPILRRMSGNSWLMGGVLGVAIGVVQAFLINH